MNSTIGILLVVLSFAILIALLVGMKKRNFSFTVRVVTALILGLIFGVILQLVFGFGSEVIKESLKWINIVGTGYVRLLKMIVMPLVFISILSAFVTQKSKSLGKIASRVILILMVTVAISAFVGAVTTRVYKLDTVGIQSGTLEKEKGNELGEKLNEFKKTSVQDQILEIIPTNPFSALAGNGQNATLSTVFFATVLSIAAIQIRKFKKESALRFETAIVTLHDVIMRMVNIIMRLTPYGVLALMAKVSATSNAKDILRLLKFVAASYTAILIMFIVHLLLLTVFKINPITYIKKAADTLIFAFTSRSSAGTLPFTIKSQKERMGVPESIANLSSTLGVSIGQNGCAGVYPAMLAVMIAPSLGINPMDPVFLIKLISITTLASFGIAGVGGGATFAALTVLSALGFPVELAGLLIAIEPLIDMGRTALNVSDSMVAGLITSKTMGELDSNKYNENVKTLKIQN